MSPTQRAMIGIALDVVEHMEQYMWVHDPAAFRKIKPLFVADFLGIKENDVLEVIKSRT